MSIAKFSMVKKAIANNETQAVDEEREKKIAAFIEGAPDGKKDSKQSKKPTERRTKVGKKWKLKGNKVVITHTLAPEDLVRLDALAKAHGMTRAGFLNSLIRKAVLADEMRD